MKSVIVLNADYTYTHTCSVRRAIRLIQDKKAEIVKESSEFIRSITDKFVVPLVIRLLKLVREIYRRHVPFSRKNVFVRDDFSCVYCGIKLDKSECTVDHVIPKSKGGKSTWENCVCCCAKCNDKKKDFLPSEKGMTFTKRPIMPTINEFSMQKMKQIGIDKFLDEIFKS